MANIFNPFNLPEIPFEELPKAPIKGVSFTQGYSKTSDHIALDPNYRIVPPMSEPPPNGQFSEGEIPKKKTDKSFSSTHDKVKPKYISKKTIVRTKSHNQSGKNKTYVKSYKHK